MEDEIVISKNKLYLLIKLIKEKQKETENESYKLLLKHHKTAYERILNVGIDKTIEIYQEKTKE